MARPPLFLALAALLTACGPATAVLGADPAAFDDTASEPDPPADDATYEAEWVAAGLDRLIIRRFPDDEGRCAFVSFVRPGSDDTDDLSLPQDWGLDAVAGSDVDDCRRWGVESEYIGARSVLGWADWAQDDAGSLPQRVHLDLVVTFDDGLVVRFVAQDVPVAP